MPLEIEIVESSTRFFLLAMSTARGLPNQYAVTAIQVLGFTEGECPREGSAT